MIVSSFEFGEPHCEKRVECHPCFKVQPRPLGHTGYRIAPFVFGGNVFGWTADELTSFELLDAFVDAGFNMIDTADSYSRWVSVIGA
jgi:hypothetical protein